VLCCSTCNGNYAEPVTCILPHRAGNTRAIRRDPPAYGSTGTSWSSGKSWPGQLVACQGTLLPLDIRHKVCIIVLTDMQWREEVLLPVADDDEKRAALRAHHALHPHPAAVTDPLFVGGDPFFDARDLVQVKYEMLRRVQREGASVTSAAHACGLSRPAFYAAQRAWEQGGLPALVPARPGPRRAHKLREEVVTYLAQARAADPRVRVGALAQQVQARFGLQVHPRSIERALARYGGSRAGPAPRPPASGPRRAE
jgi:transposase